MLVSPETSEPVFRQGMGNLALGMGLNQDSSPKGSANQPRSRVPASHSLASLPPAVCKETPFSHFPE